MKERWKLDKFSFVDTTDNSCLNFGLKDISRAVLQLNNYEDLLDNLQQQLADKDKEIEKLKEIKAIKNEKTLKTEIDGVEFTTEQIMALQRIGISLENHDKQIRHEVCEEIRKYILHYGKYNDYLCVVINPVGFYNLLDQIEKGE